MIWQNWWAFAGLALLVLPVVIHLLSRAPARVTPFPSLRFVTASPLLPRRRTRVQDVPLMLVRMATLAAAVLALAQPLLLTSERRSRATRLVRAIVVDTSASARRALGNGRDAVDSARVLARGMAAGAAIATVIETDVPSGAMAGASQWLEGRSGSHEIVVVSDFQQGALDSLSLESVPSRFGVRLVPLRAPSVGPVIADVRVAAEAPAVEARVIARDDRTEIAWTRGSAGAGAGASTATESANRSETLSRDAARAVLVYVGAQNGAAIADAGPPRTAWAADVVQRLTNDELLQEVAREATVREATVREANARTGGRSSAMPSSDTGMIVVARTRDGVPVVIAGGTSTRADSARENDLANASARTPAVELALFSLAPENSATAAALRDALRRSAGMQSRGEPPVAEYEPRTESDATLRAWSRAVGDSTIGSGMVADSRASDGSRMSAARKSAATGSTEESDARWLWAAALLLLAIEWAMRRASDRRAARNSALGTVRATDAGASTLPDMAGTA